MAEAKDKSDPAIIFRAAPEFRQALDVIAARENKTVSMLLREVLSSAVALATCAEKTPLFLEFFIAKMCSQGLIREMITDPAYPIDPTRLSGAVFSQIPGYYAAFCDAKKFDFATKLGQECEVETEARLQAHFDADGEFKGFWLEAPGLFIGPSSESARLDKIPKLRNVDELTDQTKSKKDGQEN